ncbi:MAG: MarC family protein [Bacteroidota bacterium]
MFLDYLAKIDLQQIVPASLALFAVIDPLGSIPLYIKFKKKIGFLNASKITFFAALIMLIFLFMGPYILWGFGISFEEFAVAGALIMLILGLEMVLNIEIFKIDTTNIRNAFLTPLAFPVIVGPGTLTALLTLQADYHIVNILIALAVNFVILYSALRYVDWIEKKLAHIGVINILNKVMGIILLAIAIKLFKLHFLV